MKVRILGTDRDFARAQMLADGVPEDAVPASCGGGAVEVSLADLFAGSPELAAAYGDDCKKYKRGEGALDHTGDFSRTDRRSRALCLDRAFPRSMTRQPPSYVDLGHLPRRAGGPEGRRPDQCGNQPLREPRGHGLISH